MSKKLAIITGAGAFKQGHYSRVQAMLEYFAKAKREEKWLEGYELVLLVEMPDNESSWRFDDSFPEEFDVQYYGLKVTEERRGKIALKGLSTIVGLGSTRKMTFDVAISSMIQGGLFGAFSKRLGRTGISIYDDMDYYPGFVHNTAAKAVVNQVEKFVVRSADYVASVSQTLSTLREKQGAKRTGICPNGANPLMFEETFQSNVNKNTDQFVLVYSGSLDPRIWGIDIALEAVSILKKNLNVRLRVVGGGPYLSKMIEKANNLGIGHCVDFTGAVKHSKLAELFKEVHVGLAIGIRGLPAEEADPIKLKEYIAAGIPFIGTDLPAIRQLGNKTKFGILCRPNAQSLADAIHKMRKDNSEIMKYAKEAQSYIIKHYSWDAVFDKLFKESLGLDGRQS